MKLCMAEKGGDLIPRNGADVFYDFRWAQRVHCCLVSLSLHESGPCIILAESLTLQIAAENRPDSNFFYLTGCNEPGFAAMIGKRKGLWTNYESYYVRSGLPIIIFLMQNSQMQTVCPHRNLADTSTGKFTLLSAKVPDEMLVRRFLLHSKMKWSSWLRRPWAE